MADDLTGRTGLSPHRAAWSSVSNPRRVQPLGTVMPHGLLRASVFLLGGVIAHTPLRVDPRPMLAWWSGWP